MTYENQPLSLITYPNAALTTPCSPVGVVTEEIQTLLLAMKELMVKESGVGLAGPQVGKCLRLFVVDIWWPNTGNTSDTLYFVNPVILSSSAKTQRREEGCLSFPGIHEYITRPEMITITALGIDGEPFTMDAQGFLATAIQHEFDHIEGRTFLDRMGMTAKRLARKKLSV